MLNGLAAVTMGGRQVLPLVEGGKGVAATNHLSSGAWARAGGVGTISAVNADSYDPTGRIIPQIYAALSRRDRHEELVGYAIEGAVQQVQRAYGAKNAKPTAKQKESFLWDLVHGQLPSLPSLSGDK